MKIKFNLIKLERGLVFQIIEQDLEFKKDTVILANNISIRRDNSYPYLGHLNRNYNKTIYLRHNTDRRNIQNDFQICTLYLDSNIERDKYYELIIESLKMWSDED